MGKGLLAMEATGLLTHYADPGGTTHVDSRNGFNEMSRLSMLWILLHFCPDGARFTFSCYRHWVNLHIHYHWKIDVEFDARNDEK